MMDPENFGTFDSAVLEEKLNADDADSVSAEKLVSALQTLAERQETITERQQKLAEAVVPLEEMERQAETQTVAVLEHLALEECEEDACVALRESMGLIDVEPDDESEATDEGDDEDEGDESEATDEGDDEDEGDESEASDADGDEGEVEEVEQPADDSDPYESDLSDQNIFGEPAGR